MDDDATSAAAVQRQLAGFGYDAAWSTAVAAAAGPPAAELVLLRLVPGGGGAGTRALEALRQQNESRVVLLVAEGDVPALRRSRLSEPDGHIVMPCTERELRVEVELAFCRHDAAAAVREAEDRFFSTSIDMLCFLDFSGHFKRLNPAWERTLGFTRQELMARPFIEFVHPDDRERTLAQNARVRAGGQALGFENRYLCKDGSYRWLHWNAAPDADASVIYSVARDVTVAKQAAAERDQLVSELQEALAEVSALQSILPICSYCRKIRDDENYWHDVEAYISLHTSARFSHGICPSCLATHIDPELREPEGGSE